MATIPEFLALNTCATCLRQRLDVTKTLTRDDADNTDEKINSESAFSASSAVKSSYEPLVLIRIRRYNVVMQERDIFDERQEVKTASFSCPSCRERNDYDIRWLKRIKRKQTPKNLNADDRARFEKSRDYMVRVDDVLMCKNMRCRKRFDIPSSQTVVFI